MAAKNPLTYINHLREAGTVREAVREADAILADIAALEASIAAKKRDLKALAKDAAKRVSRDWSAAEIAEAKADAAAIS